MISKRALLRESSGKTSSSKVVESMGRVYNLEEMSHWQFQRDLFSKLFNGGRGANCALKKMFVTLQPM